MRTSITARRIGIAALFVAEIVLVAVVAYSASGLPTGGIMVGEDDVDIQVEDQGVVGAVSVDRILTPVDGWVILRADRDGVPGELIGAAPIRAGENRNVGVVIDRSGGYPEGAFVSLLADKGTIGAFEYSTGDPDDSVSLPSAGGGMGSGMGGSGGGDAASEVIDKPLIAAGEVVSDYLEITPVNIVYHVPDANLGAAFLVDGGAAVDVSRVDAPLDSWVVIVRGVEGDSPSEIVGSAFVPAGRGVDLRIELTESMEASDITVLLLADLGTPGVLEANPVSPSGGPDAPYLVLSYYVQIPVVETR